jgi:hypothetical protein
MPVRNVVESYAKFQSRYAAQTLGLNIFINATQVMINRREDGSGLTELIENKDRCEIRLILELGSFDSQQS